MKILKKFLKVTLISWNLLKIHNNRSNLLRTWSSLYVVYWWCGFCCEFSFTKVPLQGCADCSMGQISWKRSAAKGSRCPSECRTTLQVFIQNSKKIHRIFMFFCRFLLMCSEDTYDMLRAKSTGTHYSSTFLEQFRGMGARAVAYDVWCVACVWWVVVKCCNDLWDIEVCELVLFCSAAFAKRQKQLAWSDAIFGNIRATGIACFPHWYKMPQKHLRFIPKIA